MRIVRFDSLQQFAAVNLTLDPGAIGGPVVIPQAAQVVVVWALADGKFGRNVLYGRYAGSFSGSVAQCNAIKAALTTGAPWTGLAAHLSPQAGLFAVRIRDVGTAGQGEFSSDTANAPGTSTGTGLPSEVAACVTKRTANAGRQFRGRMYVPGWATTALGTTDTIAAAAVTALQAWANIVGSSLSASGYTHVLGRQARAAYVSPITGTSFPARAADTIAITAMQVRDNHWDTIRNRGLE